MVKTMNELEVYDFRPLFAMTKARGYPKERLRKMSNESLSEIVDSVYREQCRKTGKAYDLTQEDRDVAVAMVRAALGGAK
jgi:hypothetical protein